MNNGKGKNEGIRNKMAKKRLQLKQRRNKGTSVRITKEYKEKKRMKEK